MLPYPADRTDYFEISARLQLPMRCPILDRCVRRAETIALANNWPLEDAGRRVQLKEPYVDSIGESAYQIGGSTSFGSGGQCPEVNLFEPTVALPGFSGHPTTKGYYDKYMNPQFGITETGHFSRCAEYAKYVTASRSDPEETHEAWWRKHFKWLVATTISIAGIVRGFFG